MSMILLTGFFAIPVHSVNDGIRHEGNLICSVLVRIAKGIANHAGAVLDVKIFGLAQVNKLCRLALLKLAEG